MLNYILDPTVSITNYKNEKNMILYEYRIRNVSINYHNKYN